MPSWIYICACSSGRYCVDKIYNKILLLLVFISVLELIFLNSLSDFSANIFYAYRVCNTIYFVF